MRHVGAGVTGLVAGFFAGLILSEVIGVVGFLVFHDAIGFIFLPVVTAAAGAMLAVLLVGRKTPR